MGTVYRALDTRLDRPVAIKLLRNADGGDDERFAAEVRLLARFAHPNLVRILDAGEIDDRPFLVMELIEGSTLARRVADGPLPPGEVASIGAGIAAALGQVHAEGIVHRDVKPANVLLDRAGTPFLADFGIARLVDTTGLTATGLLLGTPAYLAPEQVQGAGVGPPTDVYALGLTLLESLTGRRSFEGTASEITAARLHRDPPIPAELDGRWRSVLVAMTTRQPEYRLSAPDAARRLGELAFGAGGADVTQVMTEGQPTVESRTGDVATEALLFTGVGPDATATAGQPPVGTPPERRRRHRAVVAGVVGALAIIGLVIGLLASGQPTAKGGTTTTTAPTTTAPSTTTTTIAPTTTAPSTTTTPTTVPPPTLTSAVAAVTNALVAGASNGTIDSGVALQLGNDLQRVNAAATNGSPDAVARFNQLVSDLDQAASAGQVTGASVDALNGTLATLATVIGAPAPVPASTSTTVAGNTGAGNTGSGNTGGPGGVKHGHGHGGG